MSIELIYNFEILQNEFQSLVTHKCHMQIVLFCGIPYCNIANQGSIPKLFCFRICFILQYSNAFDIMIIVK